MTTTDPLERLAEDISIMVAMRADENALGVDGDYRPVDHWAARLEEAVNDALEAAYGRCDTHPSNHKEGPT